MKPELKFIDGSGFDWIDYKPEFERNFEAWLELGIGPVSENSSELFQIRICTPLWLAEQTEDQGSFWSSNTMIVDRFCRSQIEEELKQMLRRIEGDSWPEVSKKLQKFMASEYE